MTKLYDYYFKINYWIFLKNYISLNLHLRIIVIKYQRKISFQNYNLSNSLFLILKRLSRFLSKFEIWSLLRETRFVCLTGSCISVMHTKCYVTKLIALCDYDFNGEIMIDLEYVCHASLSSLIDKKISNSMQISQSIAKFKRSFRLMYNETCD